MNEKQSHEAIGDHDNRSYIIAIPKKISMH